MEAAKNADFLKTKISWAVVVRGDLDVIEGVKKYLADVPGLIICYQRASGGKLFIVEPKFEDNREVRGGDSHG
jgi:hypothetical protein